MTSCSICFESSYIYIHLYIHSTFCIPITRYKYHIFWKSKPLLVINMCLDSCKLGWITCFCCNAFYWILIQMWQHIVKLSIWQLFYGIKISNLNKNTYIIKLNSLKHKVDFEVEQMKYMWYAPLMLDPLSEPCQSTHIQWYLAPNNHLKLHVPYWNLIFKIIKNLVHIKVLDVRV